MADNKLKTEYQKVIDLVVKCGNELPALSGKIQDIGVSKKYLTEKDIEIEKRLSDLINTFKGKQIVYAEELHDDYKNSENVWIIDPISDTAGFINNWPHYAVVVSHMHNGVLQFGAVYDPSNKELFTAEKGKGAFLNGKQIHVSDRKQDYYFIVAPRVREPYSKERMLKLISDLMETGIVKSVGSLGLHYCYVACGRADLAISFNKDTFPEFAGKIIVEEAGGVLIDFEGNELNNDSRGILATRKDLQNQMLKIVK